MSGWRDFLRDVANDDGFVPITRHEQTRLLGGMYTAHKEGGRSGLNKFVMDRYQQKGDQLVDIPGMSWDDDYSVAEFGEDVVEVTDAVADLYKDMLTEVWGFIGAAVASLINAFVAPDIDDMALPPATLSDCSAIFLPTLRENAAFSSQMLTDAPGLFIGLPPSTATFSDANGIFDGIDRSELILRDCSRRGNSIFLWKNQNASGAWG